MSQLTLRSWPQQLEYSCQDGTVEKEVSPRRAEPPALVTQLPQVLGTGVHRRRYHKPVLDSGPGCLPVGDGVGKLVLRRQQETLIEGKGQTKEVQWRL